MRARALILANACLLFVSAARAEGPAVENHGGRRAAGITLASIGGTLLTAGVAVCIATIVAASNEQGVGGAGGLVAFVDLAIGGAAATVGLGTLIPGIVLIATSRTHHLEPTDTFPRAWNVPLLSVHF